MAAGKWSLFADRFEVRKPASEMTKLDAILDFFAFIVVSIGYIVQVSERESQGLGATNAHGWILL
jgi:hypothetical protein